MARKEGEENNQLG